MSTSKVPTTIDERRAILASFHVQLEAVKSVYTVMLAESVKLTEAVHGSESTFQKALSHALKATEGAMSKASVELPHG